MFTNKINIKKGGFMRDLKKIIVILVILLMSMTIHANNSDQQIALIFDASGSMWGQIQGVSKIKIAKKAMKNLVNDLKQQKNIQLSLRIYGHLNKKCDNSVLEIPMGKNNHSAIIEKISSIKPNGKTPIAYSLLKCIHDFNPNLAGSKDIILITDGKESCNGNTCEVAQQIKDAGSITNIYVIGFGMKKEELATLNCIVDPFGGKVIGASNTGELIEAFKKITQEVSIKKNLEVIGLDEKEKKVYMDVDIYLDSNKIASSEGTNPTFTLETGVYDIHAKSRDTEIEVRKENIQIKEGKLLEVKVVFGEASIKLKSIKSNNESLNAFYTIYKSGTEEEILNTQGSGYVEKTILPGNYDIKIYEQDTYSTLWERNIVINSGETFEKIFKFEMGTIVLIPQKADGSPSSEYWWYYFFKTGNDIKEDKTKEGVGQQETQMLTGNYTIKVIDGYNNEVQTINNIQVQAGQRTNVKIILEK